MRVEIVEVGPRDGLQNEDRSLAPEVRAELCDRLAAAGARRMEAVSFVNPRRVPQMAGAEEVIERLDRRSNPEFAVAGLVLAWVAIRWAGQGGRLRSPAEYGRSVEQF